LGTGCLTFRIALCLFIDCILSRYRGVCVYPAATMSVPAVSVSDVYLGYDFLPESVKISPDAGGEAWITFAAPDEAQRACRDKHRGYMGSRYIECFLH
jgi:hypothetical protein